MGCVRISFVCPHFFRKRVEPFSSWTIHELPGFENWFILQKSQYLSDYLGCIIHVGLQIMHNETELVKNISDYYSKSLSVFREFGGPSVYFPLCQ